MKEDVESCVLGGGYPAQEAKLMRRDKGSCDGQRMEAEGRRRRGRPKQDKGEGLTILWLRERRRIWI